MMFARGHRCEGLPDGPCPNNRCDGSVDFDGEVELWLCPDCNRTRQQQFLATHGPTTNNTSAATDSPAADAAAVTVINTAPATTLAKNKTTRKDVPAAAAAVASTVSSPAVAAVGGRRDRARERRGSNKPDSAVDSAAAASSSVTAAKPKPSRRSSRRLSAPTSAPRGQSAAGNVPTAPRPMTGALRDGVTSETRQSGQCSSCLRVLSLTAAGLLHSHGPGCPGSSRPPVTGSTTSVTLRPKPGTQSSTAAAQNDSANTAPSAPPLSAADIMELLRHRRCRVLKRVPKASRIPAADKLAATLRQVVADPDNVEKWVDLLSFSYACFGVPGQRGGERHRATLASKVNTAIAGFPTVPPRVQQQKPFKSGSSSDNLAKRVASKLADGDVRGAIRLAASDDTMAPFDDVTAEALRTKHPSRAASDVPPPTPSTDNCLSLQESDILAAIKSFMPGSAGGCDGLRPQHLKDLTSASAGDAGQRLLTQLTEFTNLCLTGRVPAVIQPVFCGASLCALNKKDGGIRPIAVGSTLRRLIAKAACKAVTAKMAARFLPVQVGFGVPRATEAAAHAARAYVSELQPGEGLLKLDFRNAFNMVRRDAMFQTVLEEMPELYPFIHMCYASTSLLSFGDHLLMSDEGFQQGDPLGPLLFCASSLKLSRSMTSELNLWYLDDGTLGGRVSNLLQDLDTVLTVGPTIGLHLNEDKCEIITGDDSVVQSIRAVLPNIRHIPCAEAVLLGAPIGDETSVDTVLSSKLVVFRRLASRLTTLHAHDALYLLKNCFSTPKLLYTLRCAACYKSSVIPEYDIVIKQTLRAVLNVDMSDSVWNQAVLPVSSGGLGVRLAADLALPAFLSSVSGASELIVRLLPSRLHNSSAERDSLYVAACQQWQSLCNSAVPDPTSIGIQKAWDAPLVDKKREMVLSAAQNQVGRARLIAAAAPHSGDFLHAVPCPSLGTWLDNTSLRIAVSLRLGANMCAPHTCVCGAQVDSTGTHGLACRKSAGRHIRHNAVNDLIKRALASADIPAMLEPSSLSRSDGKRPDGLTVMPWANGRCMVWDFTCTDTLAASNLNHAVLRPGAAANDAESRKSTKYQSLSPLYKFTPIAVETLGALGEEASAFFHDLGHRINAVTVEPRSFQFLMQRLSVTMQRGNAACILGTVPKSLGLDSIFYL